jgi:hypothetical protein
MGDDAYVRDTLMTKAEELGKCCVPMVLRLADREVAWRIFQTCLLKRQVPLTHAARPQLSWKPQLYAPHTTSAAPARLC